VIVSINLIDRPIKRSKFVRERLKLQGFGDRAQALELVVVDDHDEIFQTMMRGKEERFPIGPLVAFAITQQGEDPMSLPALLRAQSHAGRYRKTVSKRTGREFYARDIFV
jgi:hypothetical protein